MEPFTLAMLVAAYVVHKIWQDTAAMVSDKIHGGTSARDALREQRLLRLQQSHARDMVTDHQYPTFQQAIAQRIAEHQPLDRSEMGPFRGYLWDVVDDACTRATEARRRRYEQAAAGELLYQRIVAAFWTRWDRKTPPNPEPEVEGEGSDMPPTGGASQSANPPPRTERRPPPVHATAERLDTSEPPAPAAPLELEPGWSMWPPAKLIQPGQTVRNCRYETGVDERATIQVVSVGPADEVDMVLIHVSEGPPVRVSGTWPMELCAEENEGEPMTVVATQSPSAARAAARHNPAAAQIRNTATTTLARAVDDGSVDAVVEMLSVAEAMTVGFGDSLDELRSNLAAQQVRGVLLAELAAAAEDFQSAAARLYRARVTAADHQARADEYADYQHQSGSGTARTYTPQIR